jgi:hypothetical protein
MWKEEVVAYFKALSRNMPGGIEENHENPVRITDLRADISSRNLPNMKWKC